MADNTEFTSVSSDTAPMSDEQTADRNRALMCQIKELMDVNKLSDREREFITLRFGLDNNTPKSIQELADYFEISRERACSIERHVIRKLKGCRPDARRLHDFL